MRDHLQVWITERVLELVQRASVPLVREVVDPAADVHVRLKGAIGYIAPKDMLTGLR